MVSTRQMATSGSGSGSGGSLFNQNTPASDSARLTAATTMTIQQTQRGTVVAATPPVTSMIIATGSNGTAATTTTTTNGTRQCSHNQNQQQQQQLQLIKISDTNAHVAGTNVKKIPEMQLLDMPIEVLAKIFAYTGYRKVGQLRVVSRRMNDVCMDILNSTFSRLITQTYNRFHAIKANMPRRESARRNHPLACECDIIETCYMRLSLLQMTFGKHIERGHCCFFPGAILDEVYNILNYIRNTPRLERPYRVTDELFDLSTMAMEYFRDRIEQTLPDIAYFNKDFFKLPTTTKRPALVTSVEHSDSSSSSPPQSNMVLRKGIRKIKQGMKIYNNQLSVLRNELRNCKRKSSEQGKQIAEQQKLLAEQQKQTLEYANRLDENDKKNEEMARKFSTLLQELNKCKTELQYWRSKSPAIPICTSCGQKLALPPPEDFQALVNQGVKPEDIILNLSDDADIEGDANSTMESNGTTSTTTAKATQSSQASVFAFPDKETTAKLLAVSSAVTKNQLKRQHYNASSSSSSSAAATVTSNAGQCNDVNSAFHNYANGSNVGFNGGGGGICCSCQHINCASGDNQAGGGAVGGFGGVHTNVTQTNCGNIQTEKGNTVNSANSDCRCDAINNQLLPSEMTNRLSYLRGSNIIRTTASAAGSSNSWYNTQQDVKQQQRQQISADLADRESQATQVSLNSNSNSGNEQHASSIKSTAPQQVSVGGGRSHRSVIVSPAMLTNNKGTQEDVHIGGICLSTTTTAKAEHSNNSSKLQAGGSVEAASGSVVSGGKQGCGVSGGGEESAVEHVASLQGITSHETKKARRVQKATRCLNGSGKRSK